MTVTTLRANTNWRAPFAGPRRSTEFFVVVESEEPIDVFVVDDDGLAEFEDPSRNRFTSFHGSKKSTLHEFRITPPPNRDWILLMINWNNRSTAVHYRVVKVD